MANVVAADVWMGDWTRLSEDSIEASSRLSEFGRYLEVLEFRVEDSSVQCKMCS